VQTPNDILVEKLGLDIPPAPEVTLEQILPREIRISFKHCEVPNTVHKHVVEVNGIKGEQAALVTFGPLLTGSSWGDKATGDRSIHFESHA